MILTSNKMGITNMTVVKKQCIKDERYRYTGKEASPLGLGYCAAAEDVGTKMEGRDKTFWVVGIKNGEKVWNRIYKELDNEQEDDEKKSKAVDNKQESKEEEEQAAPPPKPATKAKKAAVAPVDKAAPAAAPAKKKPTQFNLYMKHRIEEMKTEKEYMDINHKQRFTIAAQEWGIMTKEEKEEYIANKINKE